VAARKKTFRKTIVLVSLTCTSGDKPSSSKSPGIAYTVVTQIVVTLESQSCSPGIVADLVRQQVGYDVILLDSKCFPVLDTDTTCSSEYWKGTRKILAASKTLYAKLRVHQPTLRELKLRSTSLTMVSILPRLSGLA